MTHGRSYGLIVLTLLLVANLSDVASQVTFPRVKVTRPGCTSDQIEACRLNCPTQYYDTERYLCPCYSKLAQCLVQIGCSMRQKRDAFAFCTRKGYCKDGYCTFRAGDLTPRGDVRPEVFAQTSVKAPGTPCIDNCCPGQTGCVQNASMLQLREPSRSYRKQEVLLPPRQGDPRLGVNQNYDRMPYSMPLANLP